MIEIKRVQDGKVVMRFETETLAGGKFVNTDFSGTDLSGMDFSGADLRHCNLNDCDCRETNFAKATLQNSVMNRVHAQHAKFCLLYTSPSPRD